MGHIQDRWYRPAQDSETGKPLLNAQGKPVLEKTELFGKGLRYKVRYLDPVGNERSKSFPDKKKRLAEDFMHKVEDEKNRGSYLDPKAGKVVLREYAQRWVASQSFEESTRELTAYRMRLHIYPHLGDKFLDGITASDVREWDRKLQDKGLAASYREVLFAHLQSVLNAAVDDEKIRKNPCNAASVRKPKAEARKIIPWTAERVHAVHEAMAERYKVTVLLGAGLGLRQGEVFGLAVDDVDFDGGEVHVQRQVKLVGNKPCFAPPKRNKTRDVPLPDSVGKALVDHMAQFPPLSVTLPWKHPGGELVTARLLVYSRERTQAWRPVFNQWTWAPALKKAGVERVPRVDGFHALRHFYASTLLDAGETVAALASYLGHADPGFTLRTYTHLMPSSKERTRRAVDGVFGPGRGDLPAAA
ncbi:site-specific integrase [Prauserella cavernicola]|uniref:Site-specific integrase n=1 Tax=Prauserella cavernicola TaxID=2800127 RepID=A0A934QNE3_9PSEU|nr:site-specific integrase [Prauserella cavernicola]MBK1785227.1 site-specific integrase [Prauserella cavernicola]